MSLITRCRFCLVELCAYCKGVANKERCELRVQAQGDVVALRG